MGREPGLMIQRQIPGGGDGVGGGGGADMVKGLTYLCYFLVEFNALFVF